MFKLLNLLKKSPPEVRLDPQDTFIVSYPKSGNTWVRFILANIMSRGSVDIDFHSAVQFIPDLEAHPDTIKKMKAPRIIKSHSLYDSRFNRVVYIVRDPRDVYLSYYHYLLKKLPPGTTISSFVRKSDIYPSRWSEHVASWLKKDDVMLIKYEDLHNDAFAIVKRVAAFAGIDAHDTEVMRAIEKSSFEEMRRIEKEKGRPFRSESERANATDFVRSGKTKQWLDDLSDDDRLYIESVEGPMMRELGYLS